MQAEDSTLGQPAAEQEVQLSNDLWGALRDELVDKVAGGEWLVFQAACIRQFGPEAGVLLRELVHKTGRSTRLEDGWFYKTRDELLETTGLGNRGQEKARRILTGARAYGSETYEVLEEHRVSRRQPMHYRVDLWALAAAFGYELPDPRREGGHIATPHNSESPHGTTESPHGTTESPREAAESPRGATSEGLSEGLVIRSSRSSLLQSGDGQKNQEDQKPEEQKGETLPDKRHSQDSSAPPDKTAGKEGRVTHPYEIDPDPAFSKPAPVKAVQERRRDPMYDKVLPIISDELYSSYDDAPLFADRVERALSELAETETAQVAV